MHKNLMNAQTLHLTIAKNNKLQVTLILKRNDFSSHLYSFIFRLSLNDIFIE